jgi:hypothetical protein
MLDSWQRFKVTGPFPSEREGMVVFRIKDGMSGGYMRDAARQIMHYSPLSSAHEVADALNAEHEQRMTEVFGPERGERVSFT